MYTTQNHRQRGCYSKIKYPDKLNAQAAAKRFRKRYGPKMDEYLCQFCNNYHIGHTNPNSRGKRRNK